MDTQLRSFVEELEIEFNKEQQKDFEIDQRNLVNGIISDGAFTLTTPK